MRDKEQPIGGQEENKDEEPILSKLQPVLDSG